MEYIIDHYSFIINIQRIVRNNNNIMSSAAAIYINNIMITSHLVGRLLVVYNYGGVKMVLNPRIRLLFGIGK